MILLHGMDSTLAQTAGVQYSTLQVTGPIIMPIVSRNLTIIVAHSVYAGIAQTLCLS